MVFGNLDFEKNVRYEALSVVAESLNHNFVALNLTIFDVKEILVEVREHWKVWAAIIGTVDENCIDLTSGIITLEHESEWEMILSVSHHLTFFSVNVAFSLLSVFLDMFVSFVS